MLFRVHIIAEKIKLYTNTSIKPESTYWDVDNLLKPNESTFNMSTLPI